MRLLTVGHGPQDRVALGDRLTSADVGRIVDVRRFPGSRSNPAVRREALDEWLPAIGIGYRWDPRLGGRRGIPAGAPVEDGWWTVRQFAAYAAHTRTAEFAVALDELLAEAAEATVAVMCSESVWSARSTGPRSWRRDHPGRPKGGHRAMIAGETTHPMCG